MNKLNLKANLVNSSLTVVLPNGELLFTNQGSKELFYQIMECSSIEGIKALLAPELTKEELIVKEKSREIQEIIDYCQELLNWTYDFEFREGSLYVKGINRSIPQLLIKEFYISLEQALKEVDLS